MNTIELATERLLARIIHLVAEKYKNRLLLKGGMLLRLLNSPRPTQDVDYVWVRNRSRSDLGGELKAYIETLEGVRVEKVVANSRGVFLDILDESTGARGQIEISAVQSMGLPPEAITSAKLSEKHHLAPRIVATMNLSEAFSHKIAAAIERNLVRDLFDLTIFQPLTDFDRPTLAQRLSAIEIGRKKPRPISHAKAADLLEQKLADLNQDAIKSELGSSLPSDQLQGLDRIIKSSVSRIAAVMRTLPEPG